MAATQNMKKNNLVTALWGRMKKSPGQEHEQAIIRLVIGFSVFLYIFFTHLDNLDVLLRVEIEIMLYTAAGLCIFIWIALQPQQNRLRYILSNVVDITGLSYAILIGGELGAALYPLYLWITFGNGFRFGKLHLFISAVLSWVGFATVYMLSPYWPDHKVMYLGLFGGLILLPAYVSTLLNRLKDAIDAAQIASRAKSQFLANISHDIRTPLNGIIGANEFLGETKLTHDQKEFSNTIDYSAKTLLGLIDNILDISKVEEGKLEIKNKPFDLHELLNFTIKMLTPQAKAKGLSLRLYIDTDLPYALIGDSEKLRQVLINLIGNAIKFTESGGVTINAYLKTDGNILDNKIDVLFEVIDTGIGIKEKDQAFIFDRFHQADNTDTRKYQGSGLGTAIAKELVTHLGGEIGLYSIYGEGSTFTFHLPFEKQAQNLEDKKDLSQLHVMLITDIDEVLPVLANTCKKWGLNLTEFDSAKLAFEKIREFEKRDRRIDAIIIAKSEFDFDAEVFASAVKRSNYLANTNLILVQSDVRPKTKERLKGYGYDYVIKWPLDTTSLFNALHATPVLYTHRENVEYLSHYWAESKANIHLNVLVVEDNLTNQKILERTLMKAGHKVMLADNGDIALDILDHQDFDLCIIDMHMPLLGGIQTIQQFRIMYPDNKMPFIMLTANATTEAIQRCKEVGVDKFLSKPIRPNELLNAIVDLSLSEHEQLAPLSELPESQNVMPLKNKSEAINEAELQFYLDDKHYFIELVDSFIKDGTQLLKELFDAVDDNSYVQFMDVTHKFKTPAGSLGATNLYKLLNSASRVGKNEFTETGLDLVEQIKKEFHRAQFALWRIAHDINSSTEK
ncbi:MAG: ATP-binding protein [Thioalkalispiraceae bacterium]|jgi:two-component system sensor histidine kinase RpfC